MDYRYYYMAITQKTNLFRKYNLFFSSIRRKSLSLQVSFPIAKEGVR